MKMKQQAWDYGELPYSWWIQNTVRERGAKNTIL